MKGRYALALGMLALILAGGLAAEEPKAPAARKDGAASVERKTASVPVYYQLRRQQRAEAAKPTTNAENKQVKQASTARSQPIEESQPAPMPRAVVEPQVATPPPSTVTPPSTINNYGPVISEKPDLFADDDLTDGAGGVCVIGLGFYLMQPHWENNPAWGARADNAQATDTAFFAPQQDFSYEFNGAPRLWAAYFGDDGFGLRTTLWKFSGGAAEAPGNLGNPFPLVFNLGSADTLGIQALPTAEGDALVIESGIRLTVWDIELAQEAHLQCWSFLMSGGIRYVHLSQAYNVVLVRDAAESDLDIVRSGHSFKGFGPTLAIEARRPIGGGCNLYSIGRGSLLFGNGKRAAFAFITNPLVLEEDLESDFRFVTASRDDLLPVGEIEIGVEWSTHCGPCGIFLQLGLVGQIWNDAGSATNEDGNLGFLGMAFMAGIQR